MENNEEKPEFMAVCAPVSWGDNAGVAHIQAYCLKCGQPVNLSDSTIEAYKKYKPGVDPDKTPPIVKCMLCAFVDMKENPEDYGGILGPTEQQLEEILDAFTRKMGL